MRDCDLKLHRIPTAHINRLVQYLRLAPFILEPVLASVRCFPELLNGQILCVRAAVGHPPRHMVVVTKVESARHPRHRMPNNREFGAREMNLIIDARRVQPAMRIPSNQRQPRCRQLSRDRPRIRAELRLIQPVHLFGGSREFLKSVQRCTFIDSAGRHRDQVSGGIALD